MIKIASIYGTPTMYYTVLTLNMYYLIYSFYEIGHIVKTILQIRQLKHQEVNNLSKFQQLVSSSPEF